MVVKKLQGFKHFFKNLLHAKNRIYLNIPKLANKRK